MDDFEQVFQMYYKRVYYFLLALSGSVQQAEDLTQEVFYKALLHIGSYRDDGHMMTWLCSIGKNLWLNECRRKKKLVPMEHWHDKTGSNLEESFAEQEKRRMLQAAILKLPEDYQDVVLLHVYGGVPLREIAAQKGKSESWGKVTFYRAKQLLKKEMEELQ